MSTAAIDTQDDERQSQIGTHAFLGASIALVVLFLSWTMLGELDVVSSAVGEVVPFSKVKAVQHLEGGIVSDILVREGEHVKEGQPLVELALTTTDSQLEEVSVRLRSLRAKQARLQSEVKGAPAIEFPDDLIQGSPDLVAQNQALFRTRQLRVKGQADEQNETVLQRDQEIREVEFRIAHNEQAIKLVQDQIKISDRLMELNLTNRMKHLDLLKEQENLRGQITADKTSLPTKRAAQAQAAARAGAIKAGFIEEARLDLDETSRNVDELTQRKRKLEDSYTRTTIRSPVDAIVKTLHVATIGGVIQPGGTVVDLVPADDRLVIDARLPTRDIGYVRAGQRAKVRLASADASRFGALEGEVENVSPDTLTTDQGVPFYKVRIATQQNHFENRGLRYDLFPGMQVQADIQTGTRTVLEYLLDPYFRSVETALRER